MATVYISMILLVLCCSHSTVGIAKPQSCQDLLSTGTRLSGTYKIWITGVTPKFVYCNMEIDGGGWIVVQRRIDSSTNFYRGWNEYKNGFGNLSRNFWLGLDSIHRLTQMGAELRVDLTDVDGLRGFAKYRNFTIGDESSNYMLNVSGYSGNAGDTLNYHNGMMFSTKDRNNDLDYTNIFGPAGCAVRFKGAWWYRCCYTSNLNGLFYPEDGVFGTGMSWNHLSNKPDSINYSEMKVRVKGRVPPLNSDPCRNHFEDTIWQRSTGHKLTAGHSSRRDDRMNNGWYRFKSKAGGMIPNSCSTKNSCGTLAPIWASGQLPSFVGNETTLTAHGHLNDNCSYDSWSIKVKKCNVSEIFYVYYLVRPTFAMSYCAGSEIPCSAGANSPTGFTPGCSRCVGGGNRTLVRTSRKLTESTLQVTSIKEGSFPFISSQPVVSVGVIKTGINEEVEFRCNFGSNDTNQGSTFQVKWLAGTPGTVMQTKMIVGRDTPRTAKLTLSEVYRFGFRLGNTIFCRVVSWYAHSSTKKSRMLESNHFYAGFLVDQSHAIFKISEKMQEPLTIKVRSTIPVICGDFERVIIELAQKREDEKMHVSVCKLQFKNGTQEQIFKLDVMKDRVLNGNHLLHVKMKVQQKKFTPNVWKDHAAIQPVKVMVSDVPFGQCVSAGDPHIRTFDNVYYDHYQIGDYLLVNSTSRRFEVHVRTWKCSRVSCNCGIAAREGDDVVVIDMCRDKIPRPHFPSEKLVEKMPGTRIRRDNNGKRFIIDFPSGANIKFYTYHWYSDWYYANIEVNVPSDDFENTVGLCGTFDRNIGNELTDRLGVIHGQRRWYVGVAPESFTESWRLKAGTSLFHYKPQKKKCNAKRTPAYCTCKAPDDVQDDVTVKCDVNSRFKKMQEGNSNFKNLRFQGAVHCGRRKRRSTDDYIVMPEDDGLLDYEYNPTPLNITIPKWPTKTGKTKQEVKRQCNNTVMNSVVAKVCKKIESFSFDVYIDQCIEDVKITDDYTFSSSAVSAMKSSCEDTLLTNISYWKSDASGNGTLAPPVEIMEIQCPGLCSGHGHCVNGTCLCDPDFTSNDCSINKTSGATFKSMRNGGLCDIRKRSDCSKIIAIGSDFIDSRNLSCRVKEVKMAATPAKFPRKITRTKGFLLSFGEMMCEMKTNPVKQSGDPRLGKGIPYAGYIVEVSNDGVRYSQESHLYRIYDSKCIKCHLNGSCHQKNNTCLINGYCFGNGELNPYVSCLRCQPSKNTTSFVEEKTGICKPTTTQKATTTQKTATTRKNVSNKTMTQKQLTAGTRNISSSPMTTTRNRAPGSGANTWMPPDNSGEDIVTSKRNIIIIVSSSAGSIILLVFVAIAFVKLKKCAMQSTKSYPVVNCNTNEVFELNETGKFNDNIQGLERKASRSKHFFKYRAAAD